TSGAAGSPWVDDAAAWRPGAWTDAEPPGTGAWTCDAINPPTTAKPMIAATNKIAASLLACRRGFGTTGTDRLPQDERSRTCRPAARSRPCRRDHQIIPHPRRGVAGAPAEIFVLAGFVRHKRNGLFLTDSDPADGILGGGAFENRGRRRRIRLLASVGDHVEAVAQGCEVLVVDDDPPGSRDGERHLAVRKSVEIQAPVDACLAGD